MRLLLSLTMMSGNTTKTKQQKLKIQIMSNFIQTASVFKPINRSKELYIYHYFPNHDAIRPAKHTA